MAEANKEKYNIILTDLYGAKPLRTFEYYLDVKYLSVTKQEPVFPVFGLITPEFARLRLLINLVCQFGTNPSINIIFLIAPGSPSSYLTDNAILALNQNNDIDDIENAEIKFHGINHHNVKRSSFEGSNFKEVNLLGADYLRNDFILTLNYQKQKKIILDKKN